MQKKKISTLNTLTRKNDDNALQQDYAKLESDVQNIIKME
jgi:hypothetical protein